MNKLASKSSGFTLVELMIVIAIIGIVSAIAIPSYNSYMKKSRRSDAKVALTKMADRQERYYLQNNTYTPDEALVGGVDTQEGWYTLDITAADINGFEIKAEALAGPQTDDVGCTEMTLSSTGAKTPVDCW